MGHTYSCSYHIQGRAERNNRYWRQAHHCTTEESVENGERDYSSFHMVSNPTPRENCRHCGARADDIEWSYLTPGTESGSVQALKSEEPRSMDRISSTYAIKFGRIRPSVDSPFIMMSR